MSNLSSAAARRPLIITRTFNAPRARVWTALTQAEHLLHWWGPVGMTLGILALEVKPGGIFHYVMEGADGFRMWARFVYREIAPEERLVFVQSFTDEAGNVTRAPFDARWPLNVLHTWTFSEHDGRTTLQLHAVPLTDVLEEMALFESFFDSMNGGYGSTFDQLDTWLVRHPA